jgi:hypothetical protein
MSGKDAKQFVVSLCDGLARLADVAPTEIVVLTEESDWGLVGGDLRDAMEQQADQSATPVVEADELVEA